MKWAVAPVLALALIAGLSACRHGLDDSPQPPAQVTQSSTAKVSADLRSADAGVSQADTDLGAGDSARTQPDDGN